MDCDESSPSSPLLIFPFSGLLDEDHVLADEDVGLVLVSDDISNPIDDQLTTLRTEKSTLIFSLPAPGSEKSEIDYRVMLKKILGV